MSGPIKSGRASRGLVESALHETQSFMEEALAEMLPVPTGREARVIEAMRYATLGGGKRLRAFMTLQSGRLFGVDRRALGRVAGAVECLHAYSLIHDDLPAMDDDDLRRGRPSTHRQFDEATAILAGDALQALAFSLVSSPDTHTDPFVRSELAFRLALAAGHNGMVGGQALDIAMEGVNPDIVTITRLQRLKTGAMFVFACEAGAIMGKAAPPPRHALIGFAQDTGLAFQIIDDVLDAEGDAAVMGKKTRKDVKKGKATFVSALGVERARAQAELLADQAVRHLDVFDERADLLRGLADLLVHRAS